MRPFVEARVWASLAPSVFAVVVLGCGSNSGGGGSPDGAAVGTQPDGASGDDAGGGNDAPSAADTSAPLEAAPGCPSSAPGAGTPCNVVGEQCTYGGGICCGGGLTCATTGTWQVIAAKCACGVPAVDAGSLCGGQTCRVGWSCCGPAECGVCVSNGSGGNCPTTCDGG
jgi:hypothetical protein